MRGLAASVALLAFLGGCDVARDGAEAPPADIPADDPNNFRADAIGDRPYAGEWATIAADCTNQRKIWTVQAYRMGIERERFCLFEKLDPADTQTGEGETWSGSARCLAQGRESRDFVFFRVKPSRHEMRVTFNDAPSYELVRCPSRT